MQMGVALLPRRCAESEIARGELVALAMPEIRLRRQVRLVFRKGGERSHAVDGVPRRWSRTKDEDGHEADGPRHAQADVRSRPRD